MRPARRLKHQAGEHLTKERVPHIPHEHLGRAPVPDQEAERAMARALMATAMQPATRPSRPSMKLVTSSGSELTRVTSNAVAS